MASLSRSALREHIFSIVFSSEFRKNEKFSDYISLYTENITNENGEPVSLTDDDLGYICKKSERIIHMIPKLDEYISNNAKGWSASRIGKAEMAILRLSLYEMLYDEDIPQNVAINEALELAKRYGDEQAPGFINGILSSVVKQ